MENSKLTNPGFEKLNEEDLSAVSGGTGNGELIRSLPLSNPTALPCTICGKIKSIDLLFIYNEKRICNSCRTNAE